MSYWWVPCVIIFYALQAIISKQNSIHGGIWFYILWIIGLVPLWAIVSKYTKNLLFDALLYDILLFTAFALTTVIIGGTGEHFGVKQWIGLGVIAIGFVLLKT